MSVFLLVCPCRISVLGGTRAGVETGMPRDVAVHGGSHSAARTVFEHGHLWSRYDIAEGAWRKV